MKRVFDKIFKIVAFCVLVCLLGFFCFAIVNDIINAVRKNTFEIDLPKTPANYCSYDFSGDYVAKYKLTNIEYEIDKSDLTIKFEGKKTYDIDGKSELREVEIVWQLLDSDDNVVASNEVDSPKIEVGESFAVESEDYKFDIDFKQDYRLIIKHAYEEKVGDATEHEYEKLFLGKWSNDEGLLSFQYKDGKYCGGAMNNDINTIVFEKYVATENDLTLYLEDGRKEVFQYSFKDGFLYLDESKYKPFN